MEPPFIATRKVKRPASTEAVHKRPRVGEDADIVGACRHQTPAAFSFGLLHALPSDLIKLIISYVPLRPRMLVLSLVCKSWAKMARSTVDMLPAMSQSSTNTAMSILPGITDLFARSPPVVTPPVALQRLHLGTGGPAKEETAPDPQLSMVTSLTALESSTPHYFSTELLMKNNAPSLRTLSYRCMNSRTLPVTCNFVALLSQCAFPALRELSFQFEKPAAFMYTGEALTRAIPCFMALYPQLTSLSLRGDFAQESSFLCAFAGLSLPHLLHFAFYTVIDPTVFLIPSVLRIAPKLTSVAITLNPHYPESVTVLALVRGLLTALEIDGDNTALDPRHADNFVQAVQACPNLHSISFRTFMLLGELLHNRAPSTTDLRVDLVVATSGFRIDLPCLSHLSLCMLFYSVPDVLDILDDTIARSACLRTLEVGLNTFRCGYTKRLEQLLRHAERAGLEHVKLTLAQTLDSRKTQLRQLVRQFKWLEVTIV